MIPGVYINVRSTTHTHNPPRSMKHLGATGIVFVILVILISVARGANTPDWWTAVSIPVDLRNIETAIWKSAEQRVDEREAAKAAAARRFLGYGYGCSHNNVHEYTVIPPFPPIDAFFKYPDSVIELLGGEANFMLVYGTKHIEFFALTIAPEGIAPDGIAPDVTTETPYDFTSQKDAWNLQSLLTLGATYEWDKDDELSALLAGFSCDDFYVPPADYRIKFHESGRTVIVDISLRERHARVITGGANKYGAHLSDFGCENLKQAISSVYPRALLD